MRVLGRRIVFYVITALAAITVDFFIPRMMPGNPVEAILARLQGQITAGTIQSLETQFGVGTRQSVMSQYLHYLNNILHGNFGISTGYYPSTVASVIKGALPWTLALVGTATVISFVLGTVLGAVVAWRRGSWMDNLLFFFSSSRRHTSWPRDWSSDVCSSDLQRHVAKLAVETVQMFDERSGVAFDIG